jgi:SPP1 gp7 family putative phage head morphogenesis protein
MGLLHLSHYVADRKGGPVVGAPVRPSKRAELRYRALLFRIVGWCEGVGRQIVAEFKPFWPVADGLVRDAKKPRHPRELIETTRILARKVTEIGNKRGVVRTVQREVDKRLAKSVRAAIGVDITGLLDLQSGGQLAVAMEIAAAQNAALIESIPVQYLDRVQRAISKGFAEGQRHEELAKEVERIGGITARRAKLIARDQTASMSSAFNRIRQVGAGITHFVWSTSHDERVRKSHQELNGKTFSWKDPPEVDGERATPGSQINCRCVGLPVIEPAELGAEQEPERQAA